MHIRWYRPNKPSNISVGRNRIADILRDRGHVVSVRNATARDFWHSEEEPVDVIVGTTRLGAIVGMWRKVMSSTPLVVDHIDPISQFRQNNNWLLTQLVSHGENLSFRVADHVLVVYEEELSRVETHTEDYSKTNLGVDYERFANPDVDVIERARDLLESCGHNNRKTVIYVGGLEPIYNVTTAVDAMQHLPEWEFVVLGDGSQRDEIETAPLENVCYLGTVEHELVPGFLHEADVGLSLVDDRNTLKILEYGAAGLPTVSVSGDPQRRFGGLVEFCSLDPTDVADAVCRAPGSVPVDQFQEFTKQFSWEQIADQYESVCREVTQ